MDILKNSIGLIYLPPFPYSLAFSSYAQYLCKNGDGGKG